MKTLIKALVSLCFTSALLSAQSGINYQGRLTNSSGAPVTGTKTFSIAIYPSATGGQAIYSESIGSVTLNANGVYGFQFGVNGTSVSAVSLPLGSTVVGQAVYSKLLPEAAIAGSVNVSDGVNTWSQSTGSSSPATFLGSYDSNSRTVTAIYLSQVPSVSRSMTVGYSRSISGLFSALDINQSQWLEITVDSSVQSPREKILAVPYALQASAAAIAQTSTFAGDSIGRLENRLNALENYQLFSASGVPEQTDGVCIVDFRKDVLPAFVTLADVYKHSSGIRVVDDQVRTHKYAGANISPLNFSNGFLNAVNAYLNNFTIAPWVSGVKFDYADGTSDSLMRSPTPNGQTGNQVTVSNPQPSKKVAIVNLLGYGDSGNGATYNNPPFSYTATQYYLTKGGSISVALPVSFKGKTKALRVAINHTFGSQVTFTTQIIKEDNSVQNMVTGQVIELNGVAAKSLTLTIAAPLDESLRTQSLISMSILGTN